MEQDLLKTLRVFKKIEPDSDFKARSLGVISASHQYPRKFLGIRLGIFEAVKLGAALTLASILTFIVIGGVSYFKVSPSSLTSFDPSILSTEATSLDLKIQLGEAKYFNDSIKQMSAVLDEVSDTEPDQDTEKLLDEVVL